MFVQSAKSTSIASPTPDDDPYYKVPRKLGIAVPLPRFDGLSTSELIQRIQDRFPLDQEAGK